MKNNIAIVGCGAITQLFYLPAVARMSDHFNDIWLIDPSDHAMVAATSIVPGKRARTVSELPSDVSLFIIATPNKLHIPLAYEALQRGAHILIEKPFAIWPEEGKSLVRTAAETRRTIAVNQTRRFMPYMRDLRRRIKNGEFGPLKSIVHYEGHKLSWPFESGAAFNRNAERTGVIMDLGVHIIDFYEYLFEPKWKLVSAIHDGFHGPEGLAEIELGANGARVSIRLSRYQKQENMTRINFRDAEVMINIDGLNTYQVRDKLGSIRYVTANPTVESYNALADAVLVNFLSATAGRSEPVCPASSSIPVIEILDQIYRAARRYPDAVGEI